MENVIVESWVEVESGGVLIVLFCGNLRLVCVYVMEIVVEICKIVFMLGGGVVVYKNSSL